MENRIEALKKELSTFNFDYMLNNPVTLCDYCNLCDEVKGEKKNEIWFKFFCYQFVRNLETVETINYTLTQDKKESRCKSLIYWMYDKIINLYEKSTIKNKENIIGELLDVWTKFNASPVKKVLSSRCNVPKASDIKDLGEMKKRKIMSDYCENYGTFKRILNYDEYSNCHINYDYFKDSLSKYRELVTNCRPEDFIINNCSKFCINEDPDKVLNESKCRTIEILPKKNVYITQEACDTLKDEALSAMRCKTEEVKISEFTFSDNRAVILILFSLWGVFLTLLFLYKMTPFRSWISNKLRKKKIIRESFNERSDDESLDADYESMDRNMENRGYNITYNSDWNS
ncbi:PIR Superfamily Protein [Plasmodium ovale curtisi]|uniref:PIR Superfamily Protein n=1 Tax=Plasmodium ovale curtisi TaxID=864141 RepID=A0A1A8WEG3_PLAOA|nr:PIR Superfamily Protein [Plasmodium ovale curtisi]